MRRDGHAESFRGAVCVIPCMKEESPESQRQSTTISLILI
jgi:hypothetical protein